MKIHKNQRKSMKFSRSEAVDKSPGVFFDAEFDFNGPGTPERSNKLKNRFFEKSKNYKKSLQVAQKLFHVPSGLGRSSCSFIL